MRAWPYWYTSSDESMPISAPGRHHQPQPVVSQRLSASATGESVPRVLYCAIPVSTSETDA